MCVARGAETTYQYCMWTRGPPGASVRYPQKNANTRRRLSAGEMFFGYSSCFSGFSGISLVFFGDLLHVVLGSPSLYIHMLCFRGNGTNFLVPCSLYPQAGGVWSSTVPG